MMKSGKRRTKTDDDLERKDNSLPPVTKEAKIIENEEEEGDR